MKWSDGMTTPQSGTPELANSKLFEPVMKAEAEVIAKQRLNRKVKPGARLVGLALSGGGIRSASFALGVLQALARKDKSDEEEGSGGESSGEEDSRRVPLKRIDYLSTVSGGGYIGASLTWFNSLQRDEHPDKRKFPFGGKMETRRQQCAKSEISIDNTAFIRQHGEYMTPAKSITSVSLIAVALRNMVVCFSVYFALVTALIQAARVSHT